MTTLGRAGTSKPQLVQIVGFLAVVGGIVGIFSQSALTEVADDALYQSLIVPVWIASALGAFALVWGVYAVATRRWRPLTPQRALAVPAIAAVPWIVVAFQRAPSIDPLGSSWTPPALSELFVHLSTTPAGGVIGGTVLTGVDVAIARQQWRWAGTTTRLALVAALNMGRVTGYYGGAVLLVAVFGAAPAAIGYVLADRE